jgi:hypothetical protein
MMAILSDIVEALSNTGCYGRWEKAEVNMARGGERTPSIPRIALASAQQFGRYWMHCGHRPKWTPAACEAIDPDVWSGRALQEGFVDLADAALHQCIRSLIGARSGSRPSWISARVRAHYRIGLKRADGVTSVRMRREDRSSIPPHPLADLGGVLPHRSLLNGVVPLFVP